MRDIIVRAWDNQKKCWWTHEETLSLLVLAGRVRRGYARDDAKTLERYSIVQYTGLKDKNGKEIYEGDVVRTISLHHTNPEYREYRSEVVKESETGGCWEPVGHGYVRGRQRPNWEVIGNIYENPELLEKP